MALRAAHVSIGFFSSWNVEKKYRGITGPYFVWNDRTSRTVLVLMNTFVHKHLQTRMCGPYLSLHTHTYTCKPPTIAYTHTHTSPPPLHTHTQGPGSKICAKKGETTESTWYELETYFTGALEKGCMPSRPNYDTLSLRYLTTPPQNCWTNSYGHHRFAPYRSFAHL